MDRTVIMVSKIILTGVLLIGGLVGVNAQQKDFHNWAKTPPMGWNSWDCFGPTVVDGICWVADDPKTGDKYIALFNPSNDNDARKISVNLNDLGFTKSCKVRDLWDKSDKGTATGTYTATINKHGAALFRISEIK